MNPASYNAIEKIFSEQVEKLPVGEHKVDLDIIVKDNVSGDKTAIKLDGFVNQGVDYDRTATVSVSIYELMAEFANQFGLSGDKALEVVAEIMAKHLEKRLSGETVKLAKAIKSRMEDAKSAFAESLPRTNVNGRVDVKVKSIVVQTTIASPSDDGKAL
jgi:hypothetical protein